ncbi:hypothetical protein BDL97_19G038900 [Sphagnum fallax]|nr:hypothetical protein BDL97_19G038900 [Sphagnum fallax]KAH8931780.1 hypothetical protein BDL97_19G038900 [Sphagnum fallax]KAH8931781.1 hypothetical protein BDL97_19G038900 [Sphagnum fallax]
MGTGTVTGDAPHAIAAAAAAEMPGATSSRHHEEEVLRQYYIAVDRQHFKMGTLVDLLTMLGRRASLPVAVCCSSRDSLDAVWSTVSASQEFSLSVLHSDQAQSERIAALDNFRQVVADWTHGSCEGNALPSGSNCVDDRQQQQSGLLMTTDACLPSAALGEAPLGARVLIHYDLPAKKEAYMRRMAACLAAAPVMGTTAGRATVGTSTMSQPGLSSGSGTNGGAHIGGVWGGIVINVVVGAEVATLCKLEEGCGVVIDEMPINIPELL